MNNSLAKKISKQYSTFSVGIYFVKFDSQRTNFLQYTTTNLKQLLIESISRFDITVQSLKTIKREDMS